MHAACGAHCRTTGEPCKNAPVADSTRCRMHGGKTPRARAKAAEIAVDREARATLAQMRVTPIVDALTALAEHAGQVVALRDYLRGQVERLEEIRYQGGTGEQVRAELSAYQAALRDTTSVLTAIARLNIDERLVRISEAQGALVARAIHLFLGDLGLTPGQRVLVPIVVPKRLREVTDAARVGEAEFGGCRV